MAKKRIYELAKEKGLESKDVVEAAKSIGISGVKNHMSSLEDSDVKKLSAHLSGGGAAASKASASGKKPAAKKPAANKKEATPSSAAASSQSEAPKKAAPAPVQPAPAPTPAPTPKKENANLVALEAQKKQLQVEQADNARLMEEARARRQREQQAEEAKRQAEQKEIKAGQQNRAVEIAQEAAQQRMKVSAAAQEAMKAEMELLAKARALREEKEKKMKAEAERRAAAGLPPEPEPSADRGRDKRRADGLKGKRGRLKPTQIFGVSDVVRRSGAPTPPRPDGAPGGDPRRQGRGGPGRGGPGRGGPGRGGPSGDRLKEVRDFPENQGPLDGRIRKGGRRRGQVAMPTVSELTVHGNITVRELGELMGVQPADIIKAAFQVGEMITITQILSDELLLIIAEQFGAEATIVPDTDEADIEEALIAPDDEATLQLRPPVVTVMGHVDHGKTSLLDRIRQAAVASGEAGGITQHIGAYQVHTDHGKITFLDTPGHAAFTSMRQRGAQVTDMVILVVAANDGVQPQTIEAISHAKAAGVSLVVAINKMDLAGADAEPIKAELMRYEVVPEDVGGDVPVVPISAIEGTGVKELLEIVALHSELLELKANPDRAGIGAVVESHIDPHRGAVATVLVQRGTLRQGDYVVVGDTFGRIRAMIDDHGNEVEEAPPSFPVEILGLSGSPEPGDQLLVLTDEREAREIAEKREHRRRTRDLMERQKHVTLENLHERLEEGAMKELNLIVKADVQGSTEAIISSLQKIETDKVNIRIVHNGVGGVNESDVQLADVSDAVVVGFNVRADNAAKNLADQRGVEIKTYNIIYDLLDEIKAAMAGLLDPVFESEVTGNMEVLQPFKTSKGTVAGGMVREGEIHRNSRVKVYRNDVMIYDGEIGSLRRVKEDVEAVRKGLECGLLVKDFNDVKQGDIIEAYKVKEVAAVL